MPLFSSAMSVTLLDFPFWPDAEPVTPDLLWLRESLSDASRVTILENFQIIRNIMVWNDKFVNILNIILSKHIFKEIKVNTIFKVWLKE